MSDSYSSGDTSYSSDYSYTSEPMQTWYWTDSGRERAQEAAIEQQRARTRRIERERRAAEAELDQRISSTAARMDSRLDTLFRWTELRFQQVEFDEYQARKEIRNTVRALAEGREPVLRGFEDVPGYWLPSAAAAVLPLVLRDRAPRQRSAGNAFADFKTGLEAARERDAVRTELFSLAIGRCFDQPALIDAAALRLLSEPADLGAAEPGQIARVWRTLWEQVAMGEFGSGAEAQIVSLLSERFDPDALDDEALAAWDEAIAQFSAIDKQRPTQLEALKALHAHLTAAPEQEARAEVDAASGPPLDDSILTAAPAGALSTAEAAGAAFLSGSGTVKPAGALGTAEAAGAPITTGTAALTRPLGTDAALDDPTIAVGAGNGEPALDESTDRDDTAWRSYLQELIDEPSAAELPLVRQMAELDPSSEGREGDRRSWADPAGELADLVRRDLFDPGTPIPLRRIALGLAAPVLRERLDRIEAALDTTEKPTVTVRRRGELIAVTSDGHDPEQLAVVQRRIDQAFDTAGPSKPLTVSIAAGLILVGLFMLIPGQWFATAIFVLAALFPIAMYRRDTAKAAQQRARRDEQLADARAALVKARNDAELKEREAAEQAVAVRAALTRLRESLPAETAPTALAAPLGAPTAADGRGA
ncbi:hypothetical protein [Glycomyces niveus]|uniref:Uncharacterized protein n=1 Tax=Glycomyces niveus TaxID=2820287 RepID=A0ABS3U3S2_9ACTN|nr:hypothetical protein [Glycomyces sp. NEAU-S30]MBO3732408.1 hypothetical protein [Glycomyces sp. NEAU-S30]